MSPISQSLSILLAMFILLPGDDERHFMVRCRIGLNFQRQIILIPELRQKLTLSGGRQGAGPYHD